MGSAHDVPVPLPTMVPLALMQFDRAEVWSASIVIQVTISTPATMSLPTSMKSSTLGHGTKSQVLLAALKVAPGLGVRQIPEARTCPDGQGGIRRFVGAGVG